MPLDVMYLSRMRNTNPVLWLLALTFIVPFAGCSTAGSKSKPVTAKPEATHERGWIGGKYDLASRRWFAPEHAVHTIPPALTNSYQDALLVTDLGSNSPIRLAGLQEGDLILEVNHKPVTKLQDFRRVVDHAEPGTVLPLTTWHDGQTNVYEVPVGRETYKTTGNFSITLNLPFTLRLGELDILPDPDFSLLALGLQHDHRDPHPDLRSVKADYLNKYSGSKYEPYERDWRAWLVIFHLERGKTIVSQENVALRPEASPPVTSPAR